MPLPSERRWLSGPPVEPDHPLASPTVAATEYLLRYLDAERAGGWFDWVVDADPGGRVQSWLRGPGDAADLATMVEAADLACAPGEGPPERGATAPSMAIALGSPIAVLGPEPRLRNALVPRMRWLAERGLGTRLRVRMLRLQPEDRAASLVQSAREGWGRRFQRWEVDGARLEQADRLLRGLVVEATLQPDRRLRTSEHALLAVALEGTLTPRAVLGGLGAPALAERELAHALLTELTAAMPERAGADEALDPLDGVVELRRHMDTAC